MPPAFKDPAREEVKVVKTAHPRGKAHLIEERKQEKKEPIGGKIKLVRLESDPPSRHSEEFSKENENERPAPRPILEPAKQERNRFCMTKEGGFFLTGLEPEQERKRADSAKPSKQELLRKYVLEKREEMQRSARHDVKKKLNFGN